MSQIASELPRRPRPEDFGLSEEAVRAAPRSLIGSCRGRWVVGLYGTAALGVLAVLLAISGSPAASLAITVVVIAAASVLLIPTIIGLVCVLEYGERCWLCSRNQDYPAVDRYRQAIDQHEEAIRRHAAAVARSGDRFWRALPSEALVEEVARLFEARGAAVERLGADRRSGFDLMLRDEVGAAAIRCEVDGMAAGRSLGHEMEGARSDLGVDRMILVAPDGASADLLEYLEAHGGSLLDASALARMRLPAGV